MIAKPVETINAWTQPIHTVCRKRIELDVIVQVVFSIKMKWRYQISPRGDSLLRGNKIKRVSKRSKALLILSIVFLTFTGFLSDGILRLQQRRLKCKELSELKAEQQKMEDGDVVRHLNRFSKFVDRILENGSSNPCLTDFPAEADSTQFIVNQEIQIELDEPKFTVADSGGGSFRSDVDTTIVINNYITLDEAEVRGISKKKPDRNFKSFFLKK